MNEIAIEAVINGRTHGRNEVLAWENARIDRASKKLRIDAPPSGVVDERREAFMLAKRALGAQEIHRRLSRDARVADRIARFQSAMSSQRRRCSSIDLFIPGGSAEGFVQWYDHIVQASDEDALIRACPDHFVLRTVDNALEVLETNGGSPLTAFFVIDEHDVSSLVTPLDPTFPHRIDGVARASNGRIIGGVRHQFRDTSNGTHARLVVEFPLPTIRSIVRGHRWHLACEFSNWFEASLAAQR